MRLIGFQHQDLGEGSASAAAYAIDCAELGSEAGSLVSAIEGRVANHPLNMMLTVLPDRFFIHVYPLLPIISLDLVTNSSETDLPSESDLDRIPCHLLAAIYAISIPYARNDEHLTVAEISGNLPQDQVWRIVYESLQKELHRPHLSTLQAGLLYLHKASTQNRSEQLVAPVAAFKWSWLGTLVGLAHNLGLHMDTRMCAVPSDELRIRRHLWWALYIEDKMLSLLMGRPPYVHPDEWDVCAIDLTSAVYDQTAPFTGQPHSKVIAPFRDMAQLAMIAERVQFSL